MHMHKLNIKNNFKKERKQHSSLEYLPHIKHHSSETRVSQILTPTSMHTAWKLRPSLPFSSGLKNSQETKERERRKEGRRKKRKKRENNKENNSSRHMKFIWSLNARIHKYSFAGTQPCSFIYVCGHFRRSYDGDLRTQSLGYLPSGLLKGKFAKSLMVLSSLSLKTQPRSSIILPHPSQLRYTE